MNDKEDYEVKLADGRRLYPKELHYSEQGITFPMSKDINRFVPYAAILWVDYRT